MGSVSTRRVDDLVQAMGLSGIRRAKSPTCAKKLMNGSTPFLDRPIKGKWPYLWLDTTYLKVRDGGRIVSAAAIIAMRGSRPGF